MSKIANRRVRNRFLLLRFFYLVYVKFTKSASMSITMEPEDYDSPWYSYFEAQKSLPRFAMSNFQNTSSRQPAKDEDADSLTAVSTFLQLKQQGRDIKLEDFIESVFKSPGLSTLENTVENLSNNYAYVQKPFDSVPADVLQTLLAESFVQKGQLERTDPSLMAGHYLILLKRIWHLFAKHSFVIVDDNNVLRGVATSADATDFANLPLDGLHPHLINVFQYLDDITARVAGQFPANPSVPGEANAHFLMGTPLYNTPKENVYAMYLLAKLSHEKATKDGFKISIAQNTSPLTQQLAEMFGCTRFLTDQPHAWTNARGEKPFANCPGDFTVTVDVGNYCSAGR
ncbi:beta-alanyl-bioamine nonribosomal peptide synthetase ebony-like [Paramacrobiotus metropolitanus]|uniref:beta-alanyl-bioamine nonribosomal peptide synthetase ebony-like n=1 Tax=Paramacrobiotus metropolitanus TaxID=2943436 RepID=UPI002445A5C2|nr:beta-alanyl-bioamine nonribosomal peptide synthetase ebony-like [Paramacrobiotus metropolitanus]